MARGNTVATCAQQLEPNKPLYTYPYLANPSDEEHHQGPAMESNGSFKHPGGCAQAVLLLAGLAAELPRTSGAGLAATAVTRGELQDIVRAAVDASSHAFALRASILAEQPAVDALLPGFRADARQQVQAWLRAHPRPTSTWGRASAADYMRILVPPSVWGELEAFLRSDEQVTARLKGFRGMPEAKAIGNQLLVAHGGGNQRRRTGRSMGCSALDIELKGSGGNTTMHLTKLNQEHAQLLDAWEARTRELQLLEALDNSAARVADEQAILAQAGDGAAGVDAAAAEHCASPAGDGHGGVDVEEQTGGQLGAKRSRGGAEQHIDAAAVAAGAQPKRQKAGVAAA